MLSKLQTTKEKKADLDTVDGSDGESEDDIENEEDSEKKDPITPPTKKVSNYSINKWNAVEF